MRPRPAPQPRPNLAPGGFAPRPNLAPTSPRADATLASAPLRGQGGEGRGIGVGNEPNLAPAKCLEGQT